MTTFFSPTYDSSVMVEDNPASLGSTMVKLLNDALELDNAAVATLVDLRVIVNTEFANSDLPFILYIDTANGNRGKLGLLGVLNGLLAVVADSCSDQAVEAVFDETDRLTHFELVKKVIR